MSISIWYLGSPYSSPDREVMEARYQQTCEAAALLFRGGRAVYSPIAHTHAVNEIGGLDSATFEFWRDFDLGMIDRTDGLIVLMLDGWQQSRGLAAEIAYAKAAGKPLEYAYVVGDETGRLRAVIPMRPA